MAKCLKEGCGGDLKHLGTVGGVKYTHLYGCVKCRRVYYFDGRLS